MKFEKLSETKFDLFKDKIISNQELVLGGDRDTEGPNGTHDRYNTMQYPGGPDNVVYTLDGRGQDN